MFFVYSKVMLLWFTKESSIATALNGTVLAEKIILAVKHISNACLDENIELNRIKPYFTTSGWTAILRVVKRVQKLEWLCGKCKKQLDGDQIGCDGCLKWMHYQCATVKRAPKSKSWFCRKRCASHTCNH